MSSVWSWLRRSSGLLFGVLLAVLGAGWLWKRERRKRLDAEAAAEVAKLQAKIASSVAVRERLIEDSLEHTEAIDQLDETIAENERAILGHHSEPLEGLNRDEIRERLHHLGY